MRSDLTNEKEQLQLRRFGFREGGNGPVAIYDMMDAVLLATRLNDPSDIPDDHFIHAIIALECSILKGVANKAQSAAHFAQGIQLVVKHIADKADLIAILAAQDAQLEK